FFIACDKNKTGLFCHIGYLTKCAPVTRGPPGVEYKKEKRRKSLQIMLFRRCVHIDIASAAN
ncbi:MAG: hypothetical protein ACLTWM_00755, partial [Collinsella bouchesdurhonensis]